MRFIQLFCFCITMLSFCVVPAHADVLSLKNGDTVQGDVLHGGRTNQLFFKTRYGLLVVPWTDVGSLHDESSVLITAGAPQPDLPATFTPPAAGDGAPAKAQPVAEKAGEKKEEEDKKTVWSGRLDVGASLQSGNTKANKVNVSGQAKARWDEHRVTFKGLYNYAEDGGSVTDDNHKVEGMYDYFFRKKWFIDTTLGLEQDDVALLDLRTVAGVALGHQVYEGDDLNLQYKFGPSWLHEDYAGGKTENALAGNWAFNFDRRIWEKRLQIFHDHDLFVPADNAKDFFFDSRTGLRIPIREGLTGTLEVDFDWDNQPAPGAREDDTTYAAKLGYEW